MWGTAAPYSCYLHVLHTNVCSLIALCKLPSNPAARHWMCLAMLHLKWTTAAKPGPEPVWRWEGTHAPSGPSLPAVCLSPPCSPPRRCSCWLWTRAAPGPSQPGSGETPESPRGGRVSLWGSLRLLRMAVLEPVFPAQGRNHAALRAGVDAVSVGVTGDGEVTEQPAGTDAP